MKNDLIQYLYDNNCEAQLDFLSKKIKGKPVIIYGAGQFFRYINDFYDLSNFNIIGISDKKFKSEDKEYLGRPVIQIADVPKYNPNYILVSVYCYLNVIDILETKTFKNCRFKILPLIKKIKD